MSSDHAIDMFVDLLSENTPEDFIPETRQYFIDFLQQQPNKNLAKKLMDITRAAGNESDHDFQIRLNDEFEKDRYYSYFQYIEVILSFKVHALKQYRDALIKAPERFEEGKQVIAYTIHTINHLIDQRPQDIFGIKKANIQKTLQAIEQSCWPMNASLFGHINLDAELKGSYGVQGNQFITTFSYMRDYIALLPPSEKAITKPIDAFILDMEQLVIREQAIQSCQPQKTAHAALIQSLMEEFKKQTTNTSFLLPGGWANKKSPGHAMIYQFVKSDDGSITFSIYNAGAGLSYHQKQSTTSSEQFFPVKTFQIPPAQDEHYDINLSHLFSQLVIANQPQNKARSEREFDEKTVYENIEHSMAFLHAKPILIENQTITTAGQISGTCAQRSIHQMLKVNFEYLPHYQRFIFDFKMHTLREYIASPMRGRSKKITQDIILAIENNIKLLQQPGVFEATVEDEASKQKAIEELQLMKTQCVNAFAVQLPIKKVKPSTGNGATLKQASIRFNSYTPFLSSAVTPTRPTLGKMLQSPIIKPGGLIEQLEKWIDEAIKSTKDDPYAITNAIEQLIRQFPLPQQSGSFEAPIPFYDEMIEQDQFNAFFSTLLKLHELYKSSTLACMGQNQCLAKQASTKQSFLALYDYIDTQFAIKKNTRSSHPMISQILHESTKLSPALVTHHVASDQQSIRLENLYKISPKTPFDFAAHYRALIDSYPKIKAELEALCDNSYISKQQNSKHITPEFLDKYNAKALYYVLTQLKDNQFLPDSPFFTDSSYHSLRQSIEQALRTELFIYDLANQSDSPPELKITASKERYFDSATLKFTSPLLELLPDVNNHITPPISTNFLIKDTVCLASLTMSPAPSNTTQIKRSDTATRELYHIRSITPFQFKLSLDHYNRSIYMLSDPDHQAYLEANLFQPGQLLEELSNDPELLTRMDNFLEKGFLYFLDLKGNYTQESLYFIHLSLMFYRYVAEFDATLATGRLAAINLRINQQLSNPNLDPNIVASLHQYRFLTAITQHRLTDDVIDPTESFHSFFHLESHKNNHKKNTRALDAELMLAKRQFNDWMQEIPAEIISQRACDQLKKQILLPIEPSELEGTYPLFTYRVNEDTYLINIEEGLIYKNNRSLSSIPANIINHPLLKQLGLENETTCFVSADQLTLEFQTAKTHVRMMLKIQSGRPQITSVQKKWTLNDHENWYQLQPLSRTQARLSQLPEADYSDSLPDTLTDASTEAWVNIDGTSAFINQHQKRMYVSTDGSFFIPVTEKYEPIDYSLRISSPYHEKIESMESARYIRANLNDNGQGQIFLDRYGVSLEVHNKEIMLPGTTYTLIEPEDSIFPQNIAQLTFKNSAQQEQCIIAVQRFYVNPEQAQTPGEYFELTHDITGVINTKSLRDINKTDAPWHYQNSEKCITYPIVNGVPKPSCASDALYLCYVYLASHDHDKAWNLLENIHQRFPLTGNDEERTYLAWIMKDLPTLLEDTDPIVTINSPRDVACKLKALSLYTSFLAQGNEPDISMRDPKQAIFANDVIEHSRINSANIFHKDLANNIYSQYSQLLNVKDHLSEKFTLRHDECRSLLSYASNISETQGALGYEWRRLSLERLIAEQTKLDALIKTHPSLPAHFLKRQTAINTQLNNQRDIMKKMTILELAPLDLSFPERQSIYSKSAYDRREISRDDLFEDLMSTHYFERDLKNSISLLSSAITEEDFMLHFRTYFRIACRTDVNDPERIALEEFCKTTLIGRRLSPLNEQESDIPYLCHLLYRVLKNPGCIGRDISLTQLEKILPSLPMPEILIYQAKDVFKEPLISTQELIKELTHLTNKSSPMQTKPVDLQGEPLIKSCQILLDRTIYEAYINTEITYQKKFGALLASSIQNQEHEAGALQLEKTQQQRRLATELLKDPIIRSDLKQKALQYQTNPSWDTTLEHANNVINSKHRQDLIASSRRLLTESDLRRAYMHADLSIYMAMTQLSENECKALHAEIHTCMTLEIQKQQADRLINALDKLDSTPDPISLANIAQMIAFSNLPEAQNDPTLMLFQQEENILLRPRQIEAINNLLSHPNDPLTFNESIEKIIMGGGKSKVILPLLAQKKANGSNLVIIEVPRPLLTTNHIDLNDTSERLFNQHAFRFEFDRNSDCSPKRLEQIHEQLLEMIHTQSYLVTTGESMQSLELKYIELLLTQPQPQTPLWKEQVLWLSKITDLIKHRGDVVIDEVHQGLLLKRKLNYTVGLPKPIAHELVQLTIHLYQFIDELPTPLETTRLIDELLTHKSSPLHAIILHLFNIGQKEAIEGLRAYLNNEREPDFLSNLDPSLKGILAFHKEQIKLLPQTLNRQYKEHYGPSKRLDRSAQERALAIPYSANDKPNEQSRFGNSLETLNYTTQALLTEGLNQTLLKDTIIRWQQEAQRQFQANPSLQSLDQTPIGLSAANYLLATPLSSINPNNELQITTLLDTVRYNHDLIFYVLEQSILKQITVEPAILHSDAYNHVGLYHSVQALSGTPSNHPTYDSRLHYNQITSLGTDGYLEEVLKNKKTPIHACTFNKKTEKLDAFLNRLKTTSSSNTHAIIDISATLVGQSNLEVAQALSKTFCQDREPEMLFVLYFDEEDSLCAWDIKLERTIRLATSDPKLINERLGCEPQSRFTYYDQAHTTGTDLKQPQFGVGVCLVDEKTQLQNFLQGAMRMRGLDEHQSIELIVSEKMAGISLDDLIAKMEEVETEQLREDNFYATLAKMTHLVRQEALAQIAMLEPIENKSKLAQHLQAFFVDKKPTDLFALYGTIYSSRPTDELLQAHKTNLIESWHAHIKTSPIGITFNTHLEPHMQTIIEQALPQCNAVNLSPLRTHQNTEVEIQTELKKELEQLAQQETQTVSMTPTAVQHVSWSETKWLSFIETGVIADHSSIDERTGTDLFSPHLHVSDNYANTYIGQDSLLNPYTKPVHAILFRKINDRLSAYLITLQEADELKQWLDITIADSINVTWITTTQHSVLAGTAPDSIEQSREYQTLIEQVRFFNGQADELAHQKPPFFWINQNTAEKLSYFNTSIMPARQTNTESFNALSACLTRKDIDLQIIDLHAFQDFSEKRWIEDYPHLTPPEISALKQTAAAYAKANHLFQTTELNLDLFKDELIPTDALPLFKKHLEKLNTIRQHIDRITQDSPETFFESLTDEQLLMLLTPLVNISLNKPKTSTQKILTLAAFMRSGFIINKAPFERLLKDVITSADVDALIQLAPATEESIYCIINYGKPTTHTLHHLIDTIHSDDLLFRVIQHQNADEALLERILSKPNLSVHLAIAIAHKASSNLLFQRLLQEQPNTYPELLNNPHLTTEELIKQCETLPNALFLQVAHHAGHRVLEKTMIEAIEKSNRPALHKAIFTASLIKPPELMDIEALMLLITYSTLNKEADHALNQLIMHTNANPDDLKSLIQLIINTQRHLGKLTLNTILPYLDTNQLTQYIPLATIDDLIIISRSYKGDMQPATVDYFMRCAESNDTLCESLLHSPQIGPRVRSVMLQNVDILPPQRLHMLTKLSTLTKQELNQLVYSKANQNESLAIEILKQEKIPYLYLDSLIYQIKSPEAWKLITNHFKKIDMLFENEQHEPLVASYLSNVRYRENLSELVMHKRDEVHPFCLRTATDSKKDKLINKILGILDTTSIEKLLEPLSEIRNLGDKTFEALCHKCTRENSAWIDLLVHCSIGNEHRIKQLLTNHEIQLNTDQLTNILPSLTNDLIITLLKNTQELPFEITKALITHPQSSMNVLFMILSKSTYDPQLTPLILERLNEQHDSVQENLQSYLNETKLNNALITLNLIFDSTIDKSDRLFSVLINYYDSNQKCLEQILQYMEKMNINPSDFIEQNYWKARWDSTSKLEESSFYAFASQFLKRPVSATILQQFIKYWPRYPSSQSDPAYLGLIKNIIIQLSLNDETLIKLIEENTVSLNEELLDIILNKTSKFDIFHAIVRKLKFNDSLWNQLDDRLNAIKYRGDLIWDLISECPFSEIFFQLLSKLSYDCKLEEVYLNKLNELIAQFQYPALQLETLLKSTRVEPWQAINNRTIILDLLFKSNLGLTDEIICVLLNEYASESSCFTQIYEKIEGDLFKFIQKNYLEKSYNKTQLSDKAFYLLATHVLEQPLDIQSIKMLIAKIPYYLNDSSVIEIFQCFIQHLVANANINEELITEILQKDLVDLNETLLNLVCEKAESSKTIMSILDKPGFNPAPSITIILKNPKWGNQKEILDKMNIKLNRWGSHEPEAQAIKNKLKAEVDSRIASLSNAASIKEQLKEMTGRKKPDDPSSSSTPDW